MAVAHVSVNNAANGLIESFDPGAFRKPDYQVYLYSVSKKKFEIKIPPHVPLTVLKACPEDQEYVLVHTLSHPVQQVDKDIDTGEPRMRYHDAMKVAQDIVCPNAPDMDGAIAPDAYAINTDLRAQGVFYSRNNPPTEAEVKKAHQRLEKHYRGLIEKASALEYSNPKELAEFINEDCRLAADYFDESPTWYKKPTKKKVEAAKGECPNCGESIKSGLAYHFVEGVACVIDWKRAVAAGVKMKADVPEGQEWWDVNPAVAELTKLVTDKK